MAHAVINLHQFRDQQRLLLEDFEGRIDNAMEELMRWSPPRMHFQGAFSHDRRNH